MTRRDLVKAAIAHQPTPRVPALINFTRDGEQRLQELIGPRRSVKDYVDNDVIQVNAPWWTWHQLGPEWQRCDPPASRDTVTGTGSYPAFFDQLRMLRDHSDKYILVMIYGSHFEKAYFARGLENFLADLAAEPEWARRFLQRIVDRNLVMLDNILQAPEIDGVLLGSDWGTQRGPIMSPAIWDDLIRPGEQREYDLIHGAGKDVWVHSCGKIDALLPALVEMGVDVLNPVQPEAMDLADLKRRFGADIAFWGGISTQQTLPYGTPDEVRAEARHVRDLMAQDGGYILAPAQEIQGDVPAANIQALIDVAHEGR